MTGPPVFFPRSLAEAIDVLVDYDGTAKVLAGGTALSLMISQRLANPSALVSLRDVPDLERVELDGDHVHIGAVVTHAEAATHPIVCRHLPMAGVAFGLVGNAQVRASATVGGVVAEADYASDPPAVMVALDAAVNISGPAGSRSVPACQFLQGFYQTALESAEIVTGLKVPCSGGTAGTAYLKYTSRSYEDRPCVGVAALVDIDGSGRVQDLRVAVGAACDVPVRLPEVERSFTGRAADRSLADALGEAYAQAVDPISDVRGSEWYRREMVRLWVRRAVETAVANTGEERKRNP